MSLSLPVSMKNMQRMMALLSPERTLVVRGKHAMGKSEGIYQGAAQRRSEFYRDPENCRRMVEALGGSVPYLNARNRVSEWSYEKGMPVIERRLSQMTEGDIIGLPMMDRTNRSTQFRPVDWLIQACEFPVVLFLDERNRALEGVKQAVFQLADSKAFYGNRLHSDTFVAIAENIGDAYTVNQSDPAEVSRGAIVELSPSRAEWIEYISTRCDPALVEFVRQNEKYIEHDGVFEANKKYPDRRAWVALDEELQRHKLYDNVEDPMFYVLTGAFVGVEVASLFKKFCAERDRQVSAAEILRDWDTAKAKIGRLSNEIFVELVSKVGDWIKKNVLTQDQAIEFSRFMHDLPSEPRMMLWGILQNNQKNLLIAHPYVMELIMRSATGQSTADLVPPSRSSSASAGTANTPAKTGPAPRTAGPAPAPRVRGARR
jgi:hypothetical protein